MNNADNLITKLFVAKNFFLNGKFTDPAFILSIVQLEVANFSAKCVFLAFCHGKIKSSLQCNTEPSLLWLTPLIQPEITEAHKYIQ